jgi:hypothetical protein
MSTLPDPPLQSNWVNPPERPEAPDAVWGLSRAAHDYLLSVTTRVQTSPTLLASTAVTGQTASIGTTALSLGSLAAGYYRVSWFARVTTAATVSSSLIVTISGTDAGVAYPQSGAAMTGNTTSTALSGVVIVKADQATAISYATTYASVGGTAMIYKLSVLVELIS